MELFKKLLCKKVRDWEYGEELGLGLRLMRDEIGSSSDDSSTNFSPTSVEVVEGNHCASQHNALTTIISGGDDDHPSYILESHRNQVQLRTTRDKLGNHRGRKNRKKIAQSADCVAFRNNDFIIEEVRKSLRAPQTKSNAAGSSNFMNGNDYNPHSRGLVSTDHGSAIMELTPESGICGVSREGGRRLKNAFRRAAFVSEPSVGVEQSMNQHGIIANTMKGSQSNTPLNPIAYYNPSSNRDMTNSVGKRTTRFASELERRHVLEHFCKNLACIPDQTSPGKSILRPSSTQTYRYYMPDDNCGSNNVSIREDLANISLPEDQSQIASVYSVGASSQGSAETMELLFNHLVCSAQDRLTAGDWVR